ncbi:MAG: hypothetical protein DRH21_04430 [Deltaproteobacteria bacterium]|nr:MAG: hypothetical protein DRH21_04430 [Deltaproteobacteria bacterium]
MKQLVLNIEESELKSFLAYIKTLDFVSVSDETELSSDLMDIPQWQKNIVSERIKNSNAEELIPWEKARKQLKFKTKQ